MPPPRKPHPFLGYRVRFRPGTAKRTPISATHQWLDPRPRPFRGFASRVRLRAASAEAARDPDGTSLSKGRGAVRVAVQSRGTFLSP